MTALRTVAFFLRTLLNGGVETHLMLLGRGLMTAGFQIVLFCDGQTGSRIQRKRLLRPVHLPHGYVPRTEPQPTSGHPGHRERVAGQLSGTCVHPDLIHVHYPMTSGYARAMHLLRGYRSCPRSTSQISRVRDTADSYRSGVSG